MTPSWSAVVAEITGTDDPVERARAAGRLLALCAQVERTDSRCHEGVREALARLRDGRKYGVLTVAQDEACVALLRRVVKGPPCEHSRATLDGECLCVGPICGVCGVELDDSDGWTQDCLATGVKITCIDCHSESACRSGDCYDGTPHETEIR